MDPEKFDRLIRQKIQVVNGLLQKFGIVGLDLCVSPMMCDRIREAKERQEQLSEEETKKTLRFLDDFRGKVRLLFPIVGQQ